MRDGPHQGPRRGRQSFRAARAEELLWLQNFSADPLLVRKQETAELRQHGNLYRVPSDWVCRRAGLSAGGEGKHGKLPRNTQSNQPPRTWSKCLVSSVCFSEVLLFSRCPWLHPAPSMFRSSRGGFESHAVCKQNLSAIESVASGCTVRGGDGWRSRGAEEEGPGDSPWSRG